jgi:hypothetical protein
MEATPKSAEPLAKGVDWTALDPRSKNAALSRGVLSIHPSTKASKVASAPLASAQAPRIHSEVPCQSDEAARAAEERS